MYKTTFMAFVAFALITMFNIPESQAGMIGATALQVDSSVVASQPFILVKDKKARKKRRRGRRGHHHRHRHRDRFIIFPFIFLDFDDEDCEYRNVRVRRCWRNKKGRRICRYRWVRREYCY